MFCKFCGQTLNSSAAVCNRCGREVPAKSDCGGFRQIAMGAAGKETAPAQSAPARQPEREPARQQLPLLSIVLAAVLVIALILIGVQSSNLNGLKVQLRQTQKDISELADALEAHEEAGHAAQNGESSGGEPAESVPDTTAPSEEVTAPPTKEPPVTTEPVETEPEETDPVETEPLTPTSPIQADPANPLEAIRAAAALEDGQSLPYESVLTGRITEMDTVLGNITIVITVEGAEDTPIRCVKVSVQNAPAFDVGYTATVKGTLTNNGGSVEFVSGCQLLDSVLPDSTV